MLQMLQQNKSFSDFLFFKELYFLPATSATKASCGSGNTLGAGGAARNGYFQKSSFLREYCFYLLRLLRQKEGTKKHPWGSCGSKKRLFSEKLFLREHCIYLPQLPQRPKRVIASGHILGKSVCKIFYFMGFQAAVFML